MRIGVDRFSLLFSTRLATGLCFVLVLWATLVPQSHSYIRLKAVQLATAAQPISATPQAAPWQDLLQAITDGTPAGAQPLPVDSTNSSTASCLELQQRAMAADACWQLPSSSSAAVLLCTSNGNRTGTLLIHDAVPSPGQAAAAPPTARRLSSIHSSNARQRGSIYRVRLLGPEVLQLAVHLCGTVAAAQYAVTAPGNYSLVLLQLYEGFSYEAPPFMLQDIHAASQHIQVLPAPAQESRSGGQAQFNQTQRNWPDLGGFVCRPWWIAGTANTTGSSAPSTGATGGRSGNDTLNSGGNSHSRCRLCQGVSHKGRWVAVPGADPQQLDALLQALQETCVFKYSAQPLSPFFGCPHALQAAAVPDAEDRLLLQWLPYGCRYHRITPEVGAACKAALQRRQQKVCFFGDSQTRHIYNQVVHLLEGRAAGFRAQISGTQRAYQVLRSDVMSYVADNYGNFSALRTDTGHCSHVFVNFGHWPLSFQETRPWSVDRYAQGVQALAASMRRQQRLHNNRQFFMTSNPLPPTDYHQRKTHIRHGVDWRTDPFLQLFNSVSASIMTAHGIEVADTYSIASPLFDLAYDASHYIGTVGLAQANMLAAAVCSDLLQGDSAAASAVRRE